MDALAEDYIARWQHLEQIFTDFVSSPQLIKRLPELSQPTLLLWGE